MAIQNVSGSRYNRSMTTVSKPYTIDELLTAIYEDNYSHFEFMENMNGGDCDCALHKTMTIIISYEEALDNAHL
jgi:hypothetical protein